MERKYILAHRGLWSKEETQNTKEALKSAMERGFGIETDLRDAEGTIIIQHDSLLGGKKNEANLDWLLEIYRSINPNAWLALNIKSDGLSMEIKNKLDFYKVENYFLFDNSIPDLLSSSYLGLNTFCRSSEYEDPIPFLNISNGVWIDSFHGYLDFELITTKAKDFNSLAIVSPELHGEDHISTWQKLKDLFQNNKKEFFLCTDLPELFYNYIN